MAPDDAHVAVRAAGASDTGRVRPRNEDRFCCDPSRGIFIVVDGVGGYAGGDRAAELALAAVRARLERDTGTIEQRLREAIIGANAVVHDERHQRPELGGMACVLTAVVVAGNRVYAGHVGDTRLYKLRGSHIAKLTRDHSPVGALEDRGVLGEREAMCHPQRNEVWRDVGTNPHTPYDPEFIDIVEDSFEPDAALVVCSDGLSDSVASADVAAAVQRHAGAPARAVRDLIAAANRAGGHDNVTAIVVEGPAFGAPSSRPIAAATRYAIPFAVGAATAALLILSLSPDSSPPASAAPLVVAAQQPRMWRVGGDASDFSTITAALAAAQPGDTVVVDSGTYREALVLRDGVSVVSASRRMVELRRPPDLTGPWTAVSAIDIASGVVRGLRIVGGPDEPLDTGVYVRDGTPAIEDVEVTGAMDAAITVAGAATPTIHGCELHDNIGAGVRIEDAATPDITHTAVVNNGTTASNRHHGIEVIGDGMPTLLWNVVAGNGARGIAGMSRDTLAAAARQNALDLPASTNRRSGRR
jgi:serine/threonine protein phosphatase PrpC